VQVREGANCIIGTPGRIHDVMLRAPELSYKRFEMFVLDEADRLLDMGFQKQLDSIMARLPRQRRTGLFSATQTVRFVMLPLWPFLHTCDKCMVCATDMLLQAGYARSVPAVFAHSMNNSSVMQDAVASLIRAGLRNPFQVNVAVTSATGAPKQVTPSSLSIEYTIVPGDQKIAHLLAFLQQHSQQKMIVYALTCASVDWLATVLPKLVDTPLMPVLALHGHLKQAKVRMINFHNTLSNSVLRLVHQSLSEILVLVKQRCWLACQLLMFIYLTHESPAADRHSGDLCRAAGRMPAVHRCCGARSRHTRRALGGTA
jgi:ATP-dependent RNA helicase DDX55/SPB4